LHEEELIELVCGLQLYFDKCLGPLLLYKFEKQQYIDVVSKSARKPLSLVYGIEHLLRLIIKLPVLLVQTAMDVNVSIALQNNLNDLIA
jgi:mortality factor 4-like protein 1